MFLLTGELQVTTADGQDTMFRTGDLERFEDTRGRGHHRRALSADDVLVLTANL